MNEVDLCNTIVAILMAFVIVHCNAKLLYQVKYFLFYEKVL